MRLAALVLVLGAAPPAFPFIIVDHPRTRTTRRTLSSSSVIAPKRTHRNPKRRFRLSAYNSNNNGDEEGFNEVSDDDELTEFAAEFQSRKRQLLQREARQASRWRRAQCESAVCLVLPDWVRRLDVDYPLAACGSSSDDLYVCHLETRQILATTACAASRAEDAGSSAAAVLKHASITDERVEHLVHQLYGGFDGGGTLAVAVKGSLLCEARRSGGVHVWRMSAKKNEEEERIDDDPSSEASIDLLAQGYIPSLESSLVSALRLEDGYLWVATDDGTVEAYAVDGELPLTLRTQPDMLWKVGNGSSSCTVLSLDVHTELGVAVVTTDAGTVELLSLEDDDEEKPFRTPIGSFVPPFDGTERRSSNVFPTCATIVALSGGQGADDEVNSNESIVRLNRPKSYAVACGANDGSLYLQPIKMDDIVGDEIDTERPFAGQQCRSMVPKHFAAVKCLASPAPGLLISGGLDGTLRVWDAEDERQFLYQFVGYKVWLGSLWTDGTRIVTDGADNTVIMHDFSSNNGSSNRSSKQPGDIEEDNTDI